MPIDFSRYNLPKQTEQPTQLPAQQTPPQEGFWTGLASDITEAPTRIGGAVLEKVMPESINKQMGLQRGVVSGPFGRPTEVLGQKGGEKLTGAALGKNVAGTALEAASLLPIGAGAKATYQGVKTLAPIALNQLAKEGAISGGLAGAGSALQREGATPLDVAISGGLGAATGAVAGPILGKTAGAAGQFVSKEVGKALKPVETYTRSAIANIQKAIPVTTLKRPSELANQPQKALRGLTTLFDRAPSLKIKNPIGESIPFDPKTANYIDTNQAIVDAKNKIWNEIQSVYQKATNQDFKISPTQPTTIDGKETNITEYLRKIYSNPSNAAETRNHALKLLNEIVTMTGKDGTIPVDYLMNYQKQINQRAAPGFGTSNALSSKMDAKFASILSDYVDSQFEKINLPELRTLKDDYSSLKSIERFVANEAKKEARKLDTSIASNLQDVSNAEIIANVINAARILKGDVSGLVGLTRGVALRGLAGLRKEAGDRSNFLRSAFEDIGNIQKAKEAGKTFIQQTAEDVKAGKLPGFINPSELNPLNKAAVPETAYKETGDLTTKILKKLEGKTTVSKQFISDLTNSSELKQAERDIIRQALETEGDKVNVPQFAEKVKAELLPLKVKNKDIGYEGNTRDITRYENITLPDDIRGNVANYRENIYESPIKTSAGNVHFSGYRTGQFANDSNKVEGYFGHTRIEDMADNQTRRVIEVQSDLYQKGRLENEIQGATFYNRGNNLKDDNPKRLQDLSKLSQYNDPTAHFRMIREEIKKAAEDGKTKLQFPTGETAMKIEGLGDTTNWRRQSTYATNNYHKLETGDLKTGLQINDGNSDWIITDVLGDGKFKAIPKRDIEISNDYELYKKFKDWGYYSDETGKLDWNKIVKDDVAMKKINDSPYPETFDISGKVDTSNPIYKFYEKDVQQYLKKFGGKPVTDENGVSWVEVPIKKEMAKMPVEAFGIAGLGLAGTMAGTQEAKAEENFKQNTNKDELKRVEAATNAIVNSAEELAPMIDKKFIKTLVAQESTNGNNEYNRTADQGKYGWLVGFTKPTWQGLQEKAKTQQKYKNLLKNMPGFDTPEDAMVSALKYAEFLLRDHTKEQKTGKREWKNINATELYKLYNGNASPTGVETFNNMFNAQ